jgi:hypothetical protein
MAVLGLTRVILRPAMDWLRWDLGQPTRWRNHRSGRNPEPGPDPMANCELVQECPPRESSTKVILRRNPVNGHPPREEI